MRRYDLRVSNLHRAIRKADIIKLFEAAGFAIEFCWTITPASGKTFCDVNLKNSADTLKAVAALDGAELHGCRIGVRVFHAQVRHIRGKVQPTSVTAVRHETDNSRAWNAHREGKTAELSEAGA